MNRLVVFFLGLGFLVLAFEIYLQHYELLSAKKIMWTPIVFGTVGGLITILIALIFNKTTYYLFFALMIISIFVGTLGLYLHNRWRFPAFAGFLFHEKPFDFSILTSYTPLLAPSAFIAMGGLGILIAIYDRWGD
ncbi:MAG: hypothetical protein HY094_03595 [Candidatus Melainabacteria bacterium]|nr:hypothetical protein [Candidatus Melainabacteria bacterium]